MFLLKEIAVLLLQAATFSWRICSTYQRATSAVAIYIAESQKSYKTKIVIVLAGIRHAQEAIQGDKTDEDSISSLSTDVHSEKELQGMSSL